MLNRKNLKTFFLYGLPAILSQRKFVTWISQNRNIYLCTVIKVVALDLRNKNYPDLSSALKLVVFLEQGFRLRLTLADIRVRCQVTVASVVDPVQSLK